MIVKWNKPKAGIKVIPAQNKYNVIIGNIVLLPGCNEINDELWEAARKNISQDPEFEFIEEVSKTIKSKNIPKGGHEVSYKRETTTQKDAPDLTFDKMIQFLQANDYYDKVVEKAKEEKAELNEVYIKSLIENSNEDVVKAYNKFVGFTPGEEQYITFKPLTLDEIKADDALKIVNDTWNMETLETWRKVESRDEIRAAIANQIEEVGRPPKS